MQRTAALKPRVQFARHRTGWITTPLPSAAFVAAAARIAPGGGSLSVVPACRQVTHTYTVAAPAGASMSVSDDCSEPTRAAPQGRSPESGCLVRSDRPRGTPPGHDRINGRSPGSRVAARHRLPGTRSQWQCGTGSPLTVAGAAAALEHWFHTAFPVRSRVRDRRLQPVNGCGARFVNGDAPLCLRSILREL